MVLLTDASELGGGGSILQLQGDELRFLGHWGWKWSGARTRYPSFEKELMAGVLLMASQKALIQTAVEVVWITDASSVKDFVHGDQPQNHKRRQRWWFSLQQFSLRVEYCPGAQPEFVYLLSRTEFEDKYVVS